MNKRENCKCRLPSLHGRILAHPKRKEYFAMTYGSADYKPEL
jgi:hypothetical protein